MVASGSRQVSKVMWKLSRNRLYCFSFTSTLTPSTTTPFAANWRWNAFKDGTSSTQGAHHVAQKFNTSSLPPKSEGLIVRPRSVTIEKLGALSPALTMGG